MSFQVAGECRTCAASVLWVSTLQGKRIALDAEPTPHGTIDVRDGEVMAHPAGKGLASSTRRLPHWATCQANPKWRRLQ